ncbi:secretion/DNA translocation related TadE-like protein [Terracoccus luteus]|uniref:Secretion/DNA translocation related TadE-like protein n=1 Tax=Terracoccus luteus TaxID=53356 RepID=A0A495Y3X9_9MICO|nr:secretion/DNA translocation related TadE-like protein [Terracoccus luteus]
MTGRHRRGCVHLGDRDRGSGSVLVVGVVLALLVLTAGGLVVGSAVVASGRARAAADLAALAGAAALQRGSSAGAACAEAGQVATSNGSRPTGCAVSGFDVEVTTSSGAALVAGVAVARSRAGPDPAPGVRPAGR